MRTAFALIGALGLAPWAAPLVAATKPKPAIEIKSHAAEITVTIDPRLKGHPDLVDDLRAEGRSFARKARADAEEDYKTNRDWFRGGRRWTYQRAYMVRSVVANRYVSILRDDGTFTGGAHPNSHADTILWDSVAKKRISIRPFFRELADNGPAMTAMAMLVRRAVAAEKLIRWKQAGNEDEKDKPPPTPDEMAAKDEEVKRSVQPSLLKVGPISLAPSTEEGKSSGLTFHFSPYDVDAYAAGPYTVFVPWTALKPYLSPQGAAIFGGERPKSDEAQ